MKQWFGWKDEEEKLRDRIKELMTWAPNSIREIQSRSDSGNINLEFIEELEKQYEQEIASNKTRAFFASIFKPYVNAAETVAASIKTLSDAFNSFEQNIAPLIAR